nr:transmembrane protein 134 isoform X4 [Bubalus bubalis]
MSASRPQFSIDDAFELSLEDTGPGLEPSGVARFGPLHFERRARFEVADEDKQSRLRYQNLENDEDGAQASPEPDGGVSTRSGPGILAEHPSAAPSGPLAASAAALSAPTMRAAGPSRCPAMKTQSLVSFPWRVSTQGAFSLGGGHHSSDLSHVGDRGWRSPPCHQLLPPAAPPSPSRLHLYAVLILTGVGLEVAPSPGVSSAIFFVPGFLLLVPGVYHVIFIYCAVKGHRGFQFFYLPYFEK